MADEILLAFSTFPDLETARRIARDLVTEKFAACANIIPAIESIYRWQGEVEEGNETLVLFKTTAARLEQLEQLILARHPYETPEIVALPLAEGTQAYLGWIDQSVALP